MDFLLGLRICNMILPSEEGIVSMNLKNPPPKIVSIPLFQTQAQETTLRYISKRIRASQWCYNILAGFGARFRFCGFRGNYSSGNLATTPIPISPNGAESWIVSIWTQETGVIILPTQTRHYYHENLRVPPQSYPPQEIRP